MPVAGWPRTCGSRFTRDVVDDGDGGLVGRYRRAGRCSLGKTNTPEYGITGTTESGAPRPLPQPLEPRPHRRRLVRRLGLGGGGRHRAAGPRLRRPGLDPHPGRLLRPGRPEGHPRPQPEPARRYDYAFGNVVDHVVSRTVRDSAAMLDATGHAEPGSPYPAPPKERPYVEEVGPRPASCASPGRRRRRRPADRSGDPGRPGAHRRPAEGPRPRGGREGPGHRLPRPLSRDRARPARPISPPAWRRLIEQVGREPEPDELEPLTWASLKAGRRQTGADVMRSLQEPPHAEPAGSWPSSRPATSI